MITRPEAPSEDLDPTKPAPIAPFLLFGETIQGFMTVEYRGARVLQDGFKARTIEALPLEVFL